MAETENKKKIKVVADVLRVYNKFDEYRRPVTEFGYRDYNNGDVVEVPGWVADDALRTGVNRPNGTFYPAAVNANEDEPTGMPYRDDVSVHPEYDYGTTTVGGELVADPEGKLQKQREEARAAEANPPKEEKPQARQAQASAPAKKA